MSLNKAVLLPRGSLVAIAAVAWLLSACGSTAPPAAPAPTPAVTSATETDDQRVDADAEQARRAAEARKLRCQQQPQVCVQSPATGANDKGDAAH